MTKEQRLRYEYYKYYRPDFPTDKRTREVVDMALFIKEETDAIYRAMDEHAKQQAIEFAQYVFQKIWGMNGISSSPFVSNDQLYLQFIEQQTKEK